jgi:hypothetical protein
MPIPSGLCEAWLHEEHEPQADNEAWRESLPGDPLETVPERGARDNHPALEVAQQFLLRVMDRENAEGSGSDFASIASRGAMDIVGGQVQATSGRLESRTGRALTITQLKRALKGHAFTRGTIIALQASGGTRRSDLRTIPQRPGGHPKLTSHTSH